MSWIQNLIPSNNLVDWLQKQFVPSTVSSDPINILNQLNQHKTGSTGLAGLWPSVLGAGSSIPGTSPTTSQTTTTPKTSAPATQSSGTSFDPLSLLKGLFSPVTNIVGGLFKGNTPDLSSLLNSIPGYSTVNNILSGMPLTNVGNSLIGGGTLGTVGGILSGLAGREDANPVLPVMGSELGSLAGQALGLGTFNPATMGLKVLDTIMSADDPSNAPSWYNYTLGNIPLLGNILGHIAFGGVDQIKAEMDADTQFNQFNKASQDRITQLQTQGMTTAQIEQWAKDKGLIVEYGSTDPTGQSMTGELSGYEQSLIPGYGGPAPVAGLYTPAEKEYVDYRRRQYMPGSYGENPSYADVNSGTATKGTYWPNFYFGSSAPLPQGEGA